MRTRERNQKAGRCSLVGESQVKKRVKKNGIWIEQEQKVMHGDTLYKILCTMQRKYGVEFLFCDKKNTGKRIMEILSDGQRNN